MLLQEIEQNRAGLVAIAFQAINTGEVQIRLVESGCDADTFLELGDGIVATARAQIQNSEIIQGLGIIGTQFQSIFEILVSAIRLVRLRIDHGQVVIGLGRLGTRGDGPLQSCARVVPAFLLAIGIAQVFERDPIIGAGAEGLLEISDGFVDASFARGQKPEIVPGVGDGVGITGVEFQGLLETGARLGDLLLLQIHAADAVLSFGAGWVFAQGCLERRFGLIVITSLKECGTQRQIVPAELIGVGVAGEGKRLSEPLLSGLRDAFEISLDVPAS